MDEDIEPTQCRITNCKAELENNNKSQYGLCDKHSDEINGEYGYLEVTYDLIDYFVANYFKDPKNQPMVQVSFRVPRNCYQYLETLAKVSGKKSIGYDLAADQAAREIIMKFFKKEYSDRIEKIKDMTKEELNCHRGKK